MGNLLFSRKRNILWYHNHDVMDLNKNSTMLQKIIQRIEMKSMRNLDFFTIPSKERIKYFNFNRFSGKIGVIPNYPSIKIYKEFFTNREMNNDEFHILYQGSIGSGHGIENIIKLLGRNRILDKNIFLNLKGKIAFNYKKELMTLAKEYSFEKNILFHDYTPYFEVPKLTSRCHLGIAIFLKDDIMNSTLGSASNKIYEYAAVGTPIIYFKNEHFTNYLETHSWALGSDLSNDSLIRLIQFTDKNFKYLSDKAHLSFLSEFNFEAASKSFLEEYILKYSNSQYNNQQT
jgi:glycosyltransferase involved in cell wall biosynthesis